MSPDGSIETLHETKLLNQLLVYMIIQLYRCFVDMNNLGDNVERQLCQRRFKLLIGCVMKGNICVLCCMSPAQLKYSLILIWLGDSSIIFGQAELKIHCSVKLKGRMGTQEHHYSAFFNPLEFLAKLPAVIRPKNVSFQPGNIPY